MLTRLGTRYKVLHADLDDLANISEDNVTLLGYRSVVEAAEGWLTHIECGQYHLIPYKNLVVIIDLDHGVITQVQVDED